MEKQGEELCKEIRIRDLDLQTARTIEGNLLDRLQRTEEDYEEYVSLSFDHDTLFIHFDLAERCSVAFNFNYVFC